MLDSLRQDLSYTRRQLRRGPGLAAVAVVTVAGASLGIVGALAASRTLSGLLYGVGSTDLATLLTVPAVLAVVGLAACLLPARRATHMDPMTVLREE